MLKSLLTKIKSEKTKSKISSTQQPPQVPDSTNPSLWPNLTIPTPTLTPLPTSPSISYTVLPSSFPNLLTAILSCPLPFQTLPFAQRRVKHIDLRLTAAPPYIELMLQVFSPYLHSPNDILINDYPAGVGIMPHFDGPLYEASVLVYSIGTAVIEFTKEETQRVLLEDRSLHRFTGEAYQEWMHGVRDYGVDCVFFRVGFGAGGEVRLEKSSVVNLEQTEIYGKIKEVIKQDTKQLVIGKYCLTRVEDNEMYNFKIEVERTRRISVTIRHRFHS